MWSIDDLDTLRATLPGSEAEASAELIPVGPVQNPLCEMPAWVVY